jgi:hypothetical protein
MRVFLYDKVGLHLHQDAISVGDICIVRLDANISFVVVREDFRENLRHDLILSGELMPYKGVLGNDGVVFSYDGNEGRSGDLDLLSYLSETAPSVWANFFRELVCILTYKEDRIDTRCYCDLMNEIVSPISVTIPPAELVKEDPETYSTSNELLIDKSDAGGVEETSAKLETQDVNIVSPESYVFYGCMDAKGQTFWRDNYTKVKTMRELYKLLKKAHRTSFSQALKLFDKAYPNSTIYKLK